MHGAKIGFLKMPLRNEITIGNKSLLGCYCVALIFLFNVPTKCESRAWISVPKSTYVDFFPLGAYWPWGGERMVENAKAANLDYWSYVENLMSLLRDWHFNMVWVHNMRQRDIDRFCILAQKYDLKFVASSDILRRLSDFSPKHVDKEIKELVNQWKNCGSLIGYIGLDEPKGTEMQFTNELEKAFHKYDPQRLFTVVVRPHEIPLAMHHLTTPLIATDPYSFFYPDVPWRKNGSHLDSKESYILRINIATRLAQEEKKIVWTMPQFFQELWGDKVYYDKQNEQLVALPGTFANFRMPTEAEVRWQIWTALRFGVRGFIPFVLIGKISPEKESYYEDYNFTDKEPHKWVNIKKPTMVGGSTAIMARGLRPSRQLNALIDVYQKLSVSVNILNNVIRTYSLAWANEPLSVGTLANEITNQRYLIVVNNLLDKNTKNKIYLLPCVNNVSVLGNKGSVIKLTKNKVYNYFSIELEPGGGAIIKIETPQLSHNLLYQVDYIARQARDNPLQKAINIRETSYQLDDITPHLEIANSDRPAWVDYGIPEKILHQVQSGNVYLEVISNEQMRENPTGLLVKLSRDWEDYYESSLINENIIRLKNDTRFIRIELKKKQKLYAIRLIYCEPYAQ